MLELMKKLFGSTDVAYRQLVNDGAVVVDVRSVGEYRSGHIPISINVPVENIVKNKHPLQDKDKVIIVCCASGMRSGAAKKALQAQGFKNVYNGGGWQRLLRNLA